MALFLPVRDGSEAAYLRQVNFDLLIGALFAAVDSSVRLIAGHHFQQQSITYPRQIPTPSTGSTHWLYRHRGLSGLAQESRYECNPYAPLSRV